MSGPNGRPAFRLDGVEKRYPGFTLGPLSMELEPGVVLGLIGPNGSGKTTTLNCIAGLVLPDAGEVEIFGRRNALSDVDWRSDLGLVGEEDGFYARWTARQNLRFIGRHRPGYSDDRALAMARRLGLPLDRPVKQLSRGNRTKLAIVAALAHGPRLLLLDEPTSGLDPVVRAEVLDVLWELLEDGEHAIFYSTHVLSDIARLADELVFLREGKVVQRRTKDDLVEGWRRISFRLEADEVDLPGVVGHRRMRWEHQVVSRDHEATLAALAAAGAEAVEASRMTVDEIAVEIMREGHDVATR